MEILEMRVFYVRSADGEVTAIFPDEFDHQGNVDCYAHVGQHGSATEEFIAECDMATASEYAELHEELNVTYDDYRLVVVEREVA